jgi:hypothetical protein
MGDRALPYYRGRKKLLLPGAELQRGLGEGRTQPLALCLHRLVNSIVCMHAACCIVEQSAAADVAANTGVYPWHVTALDIAS